MAITGAPCGKPGSIVSIMARMTRGTPAMTKTLPMRKPGATEALLGMGAAPSGKRAMRWRMGLNSFLP